MPEDLHYFVFFSKNFDRASGTLVPFLSEAQVNQLLPILDEKGLIDWSEICLDGSNIHASKDTAGAKKHPISLMLMRWLWYQNPPDNRWKWFSPHLMLTEGQAHESQSAIPLLDGIGIQRKYGFMKRLGKAVLADKGYSGEKLRGYLSKLRVKSIIPYKINEKDRADGRTQFDE
ncbi:transposase [Xenorhabdus sp. Flor]|nr:transposase [Xenorhabdus sp. Flor]